ncbi:hypothetical protein ACOMHN_060538 [Nucella lapillus]
MRRGHRIIMSGVTEVVNEAGENPDSEVTKDPDEIMTETKTGPADVGNELMEFPIYLSEAPMQLNAINREGH